MMSNDFREKIEKCDALEIHKNTKANKGFYSEVTDLSIKMRNYVLDILKMIEKPVVRFMNSTITTGKFFNDNIVIPFVRNQNVIIVNFIISISEDKSYYLNITGWSLLPVDTNSTDIQISYSTLKFQSFHVDEIKKIKGDDNTMDVEEHEEYNIKTPILLMDKGTLTNKITLEMCGIFVLNYIIFMGDVLIMKLKNQNKPYKVLINYYSNLKLTYPFLNEHKEFNTTHRLFKLYIIIRKNNIKFNELIVDFESYQTPDLMVYLDFAEYFIKMESIEIVYNILNNHNNNNKAKYSILIKTVSLILEELIDFSIVKKGILSCNKLNAFIKKIQSELKSMIIEKKDDIELIKMNFAFMLYLLSFDTSIFKNIKTPTSTNIYDELNKLNFENNIDDNIIGLITNGYIYITPITFLIRVLPKIQRFIARYHYFKIYAIIPFPENQIDQLKNYSSIFGSIIDNHYFGNMQYDEYNIKTFIEYVLNNCNTFKSLNNINTLNERLSTIKINDNIKLSSSKIIDYHNFIQDIEDLFQKNIVPPCIKRIDSNVHLKNPDRFLYANYLYFIGVKKEEIEKIGVESRKEITSQYQTITTNTKQKYYPVNCSTIIEGRFNNCFICPLKDEKKPNELHDNVIQRCQKANGTKHYSPVSFTEFKLNELINKK